MVVVAYLLALKEKKTLKEGRKESRKEGRKEGLMVLVAYLLTRPKRTA
jgi:hypothetical protein